MIPKLIGLGHKARQGKMTVAKAIHYAYPKETWIFSLADALKAYCRVNGWMSKKDGPLLQMFGTDIIRRRVDNNRWITVLSQTIDEFAEDYGCKYALIQDVRLRNEADWIKQAGGCLINVVRTNPDGSRFIATDRDPKHESETSLDGYDQWDATLTAQSGDLPALSAQGVEVFRRFLG